MDTVHKVLTFLTNPLTFGLVGLLAVVSWRWLVVVKKAKVKGAIETEGRNSRREANDLRERRCLTTLVIVWLWLWSTPLMTRWIGLPLEVAYPPVAAESCPEGDAICLLGGGMGCWSGGAEMWLNADRVWMAAKLWRAGKAKTIVITGGDVWNSTVPLLQDFGVPTNAVRHIQDAKNTEGEAAHIAGVMREGARVLLVTSAWHMRRAEWLFKRAGLDVVPVACDYEVSARHAGQEIGVNDFLPCAEVLFRNSYLWKEWFAYLCYRIRDWF